METLSEVYKRLKERKAELEGLRAVLRDELAQNREYQETTRKLDALHSKKSSMEIEVAANTPSVSGRIEALSSDIRGDEELLADIALNMYVKGESAVARDEDGNIATPEFSVRFVEAGGIAMTEEPDAEDAEAAGIRASAEQKAEEYIEHGEFEPAM